MPQRVEKAEDVERRFALKPGSLTGRHRIDSWQLQWDRSYGIEKRQGWSICLNGSFLVQLEPSLLRAVCKAWRTYRLIRRDGYT